MRVALFLVFLAVAHCQDSNEIDEESTTFLATNDPSTTTTTQSLEKPLKEPGCYWTECKSPLTYNLKCPPDTQEQNANNDLPCEGIFTKYQCCPKKDSDFEETKKPQKKVEKLEKDEKKVVPKGV